MTLTNISISQYLVGKLRKAVISGDLIDYNPNRSGQFGNYIYDDAPKLAKLMKNKNNFPRISIESVSQNTDHRMGQMSDSYLMRETLKITCYSVRDLVCTIKDSIDTKIFYDFESIYPLANQPVSQVTMITGIQSGMPRTFINGTDYQLIDNNEDGFYDSIQFINNPDNNTEVEISYNRKGDPSETVRIMAQNINEYFRKNWRLNWSEHKVFNYKVISSNPIKFEEESGLYQWEITSQFNTFNGLETI